MIDRPTELDAITVEFEKNQRIIKCFCGEKVVRSIVPHLRTKHPTEWQEWTTIFIKLRALGYPLKRIMRLFRAGNNRLLFSWTVIERAIRYNIETSQLSYHPPPRKGILNWKPNNTNLETTTVWDFPRRGTWAVHSGDYRGNWAPQIPHNLITRYTQKGELVIDAFAGGGTTLIEAWLLERPSIGIDIAKLAIQTINAKLEEMENLAKADNSVHLDSSLRPKVIEGNALKLNSLLKLHHVNRHDVKLICVHPPYLDSLKYTVNNNNDLAKNSDPKVFCSRLKLFAQEARCVLSDGGVCAVLIGDVRKHGKFVPLGYMTLQTFLAQGFEIESIVIKTQHKDRSSEFYMGHQQKMLLFAHEYLYILRKI